MAVHVEVNGDDIKVLNVDCAIDCGQILNTDGAICTNGRRRSYGDRA